MSDNETACTSCAHKDVCKYKEGYLKVCEAASNINVTLNDHYVDGARARIIPAANFDCVECIEVHCKHYERASDIIRSNAYA